MRNLSDLPEGNRNRAAAEFLDWERFAPLTKVTLKSGDLATLTPYPAQLKMWRLIEPKIKAGLPVRVVAHKARQVMISTMIASLAFQRTAFFPGRRAGIFAHLQDAAENLFKYYETFAETYRPSGDYGISIDLPKETEHNASAIEWANGSRVQVFTGGNPNNIRSHRSNFLHLSEFAFFENQEAALTAAMQTMLPVGGTYAFIESTANEAGDEFEKLVLRAMGGDEVWDFFFFATHEHPQHRMELGMEPAAFQRKLTKEEQVMRSTFGVPLEFIAWRRYKIAEMNGNLDKFRQEHPMTPQEAFLFAGRPRFQISLIARQPVDLQPLVGNLMTEEMLGRKFTRLQPHEQGIVKTYKLPEKGHRYSIGADSAKGIDRSAKAGGTRDADYTVAQVLDMANGEQVATLRVRASTYESAIYVTDLARYYNFAFVMPEANDSGFIEQLLQTGYPLELFARADGQVLQGVQGQLGDYGFLTTASKTHGKLMLISVLEAALYEGGIIVHDAVTVHEMRTFVKKPDGKEEASGTGHDDTVIALALAVYGMRFAPAVFQMIDQRRESPMTSEAIEVM
jgi:hypothetical protein